MDSDGEDSPFQIIELLTKAEKEKAKKIIFAQRKKEPNRLFLKQGIFLQGTF